MNTYHYTYLIINSQPTMEERYYIGVRSCKINPNDDNSYMSSSNYLKGIIKDDGIDKFEKIIIEEFSTRAEASLHEVELHKEYDVAANKQFYNKARAKRNGFSTYGNTEATAKGIATKADPVWKATKGKEQQRNRINTLMSPIWKATTGRQAIAKLKATVNTPEYKKLKSEQVKQAEETRNNPNWKTVKDQKIASEKQTKADPTWQRTVWKDAVDSQKQTKQSAEYKELHYMTCPHCDKYVDKGNFNRWHGNNCKHRDK